MPSLYEQAIETILTEEAKERKEELARYIGRLHDTLREAHQTINRRFLMLLIIWGIAIAIAQGLLSEANISGFKVATISYLLPAFPIVVGLISYDMFCAFSASTLRMATIRWWYKNTLPKVANNNLDYLCMSPSFITVEPMVVKSNKDFKSNITRFFMMFLFYVFIIYGPFFAIAQITYFGYIGNTCSKSLLLISTVFGLGLWLRGFVVISTGWKPQSLDVKVGLSVKKEEPLCKP